MPNQVFAATTLPSLFHAVARRLFAAERALSTPRADVSITIQDATISINASLRGAISLGVDGRAQFVPLDYTADIDPVFTGTPLEGLAADSLAEALMIAAIQLNAAEDTYLAISGNVLPAGVDVTYNFTAGLFNVIASVPYTAVLDASDNQVMTITNYLA